ncbi:Vacuolar protein sorting-associated protein 55 [Tieghemiomyces parasiticus]|uniref:Vacuolar protein sorting-associated protein 55 n=1 Tax=Tieghemiomyces parasiticus TaxID=78921 RepID=A0A9W8DI50_9FUNG|nr:Vacuolar protein sorting-associated protein 55 [Tieghemiomyces parasiticus]
MAGVKVIVILALCLALGFLLAILSCALYGNWWPLIVVFTYCLAPAPNAIFGRIRSSDPLADSSSGAADIGRFITSMFIISGFGLPLVLAHADVITHAAMVMSIAGGLLVYGSIIVYIYVFSDREEF